MLANFELFRYMSFTIATFIFVVAHMLIRPFREDRLNRMETGICFLGIS